MAKQYHLKAGNDGEWRVELKSGKRALKITETKSEARDYAKQVAQNQNGKLKIYTKSGKIQNEFDYSG